MNQKTKLCNVVRLMSLVTLLTVAQVFGGDLITKVTRAGSESVPPQVYKPFGEYAQCYVDRSHLYSALPPELPELLGAEYVVTAENDRNVEGLTMGVTLSQDATVYLILDNSLASTGDGIAATSTVDSEMTWINQFGFTDTGFDVGIDEWGNGFVNDYSSILVTKLPAGTHYFGQQNGGMSPHMYGIVAIPSETKEAIPVSIDIKPDKLNTNSKGKWITCTIIPPAGSNVADIDISSILLNGTFPADWAKAKGKHKGKALLVKFLRSAIQASLTEGLINITVTGELTDGSMFEGKDTIRVKNKGSRRRLAKKSR